MGMLEVERQASDARSTIADIEAMVAEASTAVVEESNRAVAALAARIGVNGSQLMSRGRRLGPATERLLAEIERKASESMAEIAAMKQELLTGTHKVAATAMRPLSQVGPCRMRRYNQRAGLK